MYWTVDLNARLLSTAATLDETVEKVLCALLERPTVLGPVSYANVSEGSVGARFDLEAPDFEAAIATGLELFTEALDAAGVGAVQIIHGQALEDDPATGDLLERKSVAV
jgi:hypothetical protein